MRHLVQFSGGVGSWMAARRVAEQHGTESMTLLFADVLMECDDLYRFIEEAAANVGVPLTRISAGIDPWALFDQQGMIGNTRADLCSRILKRDLLRDYRNEHFDPDDTIVYFGVDWTEQHRIERLRQNPDHASWQLEAPLCDPPYLSKRDMLNALEAEGIKAPSLYRDGFPHNNCGGWCIKAGQAQFERLLRLRPETYAYHEGREEAFRERTGKDVSVMRDRSGGTTTPLTMRAFRERLERQIDAFDAHEWGGCGCAL